MLGHAADGKAASARARSNHINFTGSVAGGKAIERAAAGTFASLGLELGGKDPAYVLPDAKLDHAIENLVDGAFYNSGQCCCGIERIYVHEKVFEPFVEGFVDLTKKYVVGNPLDAETTIGPMARASFADHVRNHNDEALRKGAKPHIEMKVENDGRGSPYIAPEVLTNVNHQMAVMREETFGPVVGIMKVRDDDEAIELMNDSPYGLTASIWTTDMDRAAKIGERVETGTVFMNRCDYVDPGLVWTGVKDTGRGAALSHFGFHALTRPKSFHLRERQMTNLVANWSYPTAIRFGAGRISELRRPARAPGIVQPLLVTDAGLAKLDITAARARHHAGGRADAAASSPTCVRIRSRRTSTRGVERLQGRRP